MNAFSSLLEYFLHIDEKLTALIAAYGGWTYGILFLVLFCETGLVITPFLPGDSLLFAAGAFAAQGSLNILVLFVLLLAAAILGDSMNYWVGHRLGERIFTDRSRVLKKSYLERTHRFYEKYGGTTIILARFVPIVRTIAPFVAGVGVMTYPKFLLYNVAGGALWVALFTFGGFFFGNLPFVKANFEWVIVIIVLVSLLPPFIEYWRHRHHQQSFSRNNGNQ